MTRTFIETHEFSRMWYELGFDDDDLTLLQIDLLENSLVYPIIKGTGGLRKMMYACDGKGKSGSVRVYYVDFSFQGIIYLITVYSKKMKDNLSREERSQIKKMISVLKESI